MSDEARVLIVGVGQIGLASARALTRVGAVVHLLDCEPRSEFITRYLPTIPLENLISTNCTDVDVISRYVYEHDIKIVVFSAGFSTHLVNGDPDLTRRLFSVDLDNLIAAVFEVGVHRIIAMSSLAVYDRHENHDMLCETSTLNMRSSYAGAHLMLEKTLAQWREKIDVIILRLAGVFGVHPAGKGSSSTLLVERMLLSAIANRALTVKGYPDDADDLIFSGQVGEVVSALALKPIVSSDTFNVARDSLITLKQISDLMQQLFGSDAIRIAPPDKERLVASRPPMTSKKLREIFGIDLRRSLREDVIDYASMLGLPMK